MASIAVGQFSEIAVNAREKCSYEGRNRPQVAEVVIDFRGSSCRVRVWMATALQKRRQISEPHSSRNPFSSNVSVCQKNFGIALQERGEIPGEEACRKDFARKL